MARQANLGLGQRPRLVGAQHIHGAEVVDGGQTLHDDAMPSEPSCPIGQRHGDHHGQQLGCKADGESQRKQKRVQPWAMEQHIGGQHEQHQEDGEAHHQEAELPDALGKCVRRPRRRQPFGKTAQLGRAPGAAHQRRGGATDHRSSHAEEVHCRGRGLGWSGKLGWLLFDWVGLAGEERLVHEEIARREQPAIARHEIPGSKLDHVPRHELVDRNLAAASIAKHAGLEPHRAAQRVDGILGPALLDDVEHHAQQDDADDNDKARHLTGPGRETAGKQQDEHERIGKALDRLPPEGTAPVAQCVIGAVFDQPPLGLFGAEAAGCCAELAEEPVEGAVPGQALNHCGAPMRLPRICSKPSRAGLPRARKRPVAPLQHAPMTFLCRLRGNAGAQ